LIIFLSKGPIKPITFAGQQVKRFIAIPPQPGPTGLAIGIISYDDKVSISTTIHKMKKYPRISQRISELIKIEWEKILQDAKLELRDSNLKDQELEQVGFYWISFLLFGFINLCFFYY
jgi:hypothetical protein